MAKRRRKHRKNSSTPSWVVPAIVVSGLVSVWLWKQANPGVSLNPTPPSPPPA
jgi:hypothetical protein